MIEVTKFKMAGRDWPYVVEFERPNPETEKLECLTLRTGATPRSTLIAQAGKVVALAVELCGIEEIRLIATVRISLASVTWSGGDDSGSKLEITVFSRFQKLDGIGIEISSKLLLPKISDREEVDFKASEALDSPKNRYIIAVGFLRELVAAYAEGESEQGDLFQQQDQDHAQAAGQ